MIGHKASVANPHGLWQAVFTGGVLTNTKER